MPPRYNPGMSDDALAQETKTCPMCGAIVAALDSKCGACGENLTDAYGQIGAGEGSLAIDEIRAFVGRRADYYLKKWHGTLAGEARGTGFNWAAFLLSGLWIPYRKMYLVALVFYGIVIAESIAEEVIFVGILGREETPAVVDRITAVIAAAVCGAFGNRWYLSRVRKEISSLKVQGMTEEAVLETLARRGGTSLGAALGFFLLFMTITFVVFMAIGMILPGE
jgi:hypothetical protein